MSIDEHVGVSERARCSIECERPGQHDNIGIENNFAIARQ